MDKRYQLVFTGPFFSKTMLQGVEETVGVSMCHNAAADNVFHHFAAHTSQADGAVVHRIITFSFILVDGSY